MKIAVKLNITTDELLFGKDSALSSIDISNFSVGAISKTFNGTVNMPALEKESFVFCLQVYSCTVFQK